MTKLLQLNQLPLQYVAEISQSFDDLPETDHKDGKYRLRRYSRLQPFIGNIVRQPKQKFTQGYEYNKFQGDVDREFEELEDSVIDSVGFLQMCRIFMQENYITGGTIIDVHQMRILANDEEAEVSPEGVHQDGYDCIAMIGIARQNITGGDLLIYKSNVDGHDPSPCMTFCLDDGDMILLDDKSFWHNAAPIKPVDPSKIGYMDAFILTATRWNDTGKVKDQKKTPAEAGVEDSLSTD
jgi:hypothetical protein